MFSKQPLQRLFFRIVFFSHLALLISCTPNTTSTKTVSNNLDIDGVVHTFKKQRAELKREFKEAHDGLQASIKYHGSESIQVAEFYEHLAKLYLKSRIHIFAARSEAIYFSHKAEKIRKKNGVPQDQLEKATSLYIQAISEMNNVNDILPETRKETEKKLITALAIRKRKLAKGHKDIVRTLHALGTFYFQMNEFLKAKEYLELAIRESKKAVVKNNRLLLRNLYQSSVVSFGLGDFQKSQSEMKQIFSVLEKIPKEEKDVTSLNIVINTYRNLSQLYRYTGALEQAEENITTALLLTKQFNGFKSRDAYLDLINSAEIYIEQEEYQKAEKLLLMVRDAVTGNSMPRVLWEILMGLNRIYCITGNFEKAYRLQGKMLPPDATGFYYLKRKMYNYAIPAYEEAIESHKGDIFNSRAFCYIGLAFAYEGIDNSSRAEKYFDLAIKEIEKQWLLMGHGNKINFLNGFEGNFKRITAYEGMIRVLSKRNRPKDISKAFYFAEMVKSKILVQLMASRSLSGGKMLPFLKKDKEHQIQIVAARKKVEFFTGKDNSAEKKKAMETLQLALSEYEAFINEVKLNSVEQKSLISPEIISVKRVQELLGPEVTLLEYYLADKEMYVWTITNDSLELKTIGIGKRQLSKVVNKVIDKNISDRPRRSTPLLFTSSRDLKRKKSDKKEREDNRLQFKTDIRWLYNKIFAPIEQTVTTDHIAIVPHGILHKLPFAALYDGEKYLIQKKTISTVSSATVLSYLVKKRSPDNGKFVAFYNPKTDHDPLKFTRIEVEGVRKYFKDTTIYKGVDASEFHAKSFGNDPDVLHFATHGEFNDRHPMQSGLLLAKDPLNDGMLQVHELFDLKLKGVNLVALSACETGLSQVTSGDDLIGLSRGFFYAGTPSLLATLWRVDDHATLILMSKFYENWRHKSMKKAEALSQAQRSIISMPEYNHPFYWAPFVMVGDWM